MPEFEEVSTIRSKFILKDKFAFYVARNEKDRIEIDAFWISSYST